MNGYAKLILHFSTLCKRDLHSHVTLNDEQIQLRVTSEKKI